MDVPVAWGRRREWELETDNGTNEEFGDTICVLHREEESGKANRERDWGTASLNWTKELKRGTE